MSERKVQNKYISKYFNHEKLVKPRVALGKQHNVRMMIPFSIKCDTCGNYFKGGTKINMRKETCRNEEYLGIPIYRLYMKCLICYSEMSMKTDPKNHGYIMEHGAVRQYEAWSDLKATEKIIQERKEKNEQGDVMKCLESKTYDSKKELNMLEKIEDLKNINRENAKNNPMEIIEKLKKSEKKEFLKELEKLIEKQKTQQQENQSKNLVFKMPQKNRAKKIMKKSLFKIKKQFLN